MKNKTQIFELDKEEQALSDTFDRDELKSAKGAQSEMLKAKHAAENYVRNDMKSQPPE